MAPRGTAAPTATEAARLRTPAVPGPRRRAGAGHHSGVLHSLLGLGTLDDVLSHPVAGASWEGFMIENLIAAAPFGTDAWFYRTRAGAEIDLLLQLPDRQLWAIEIEPSTAPRAARGFELAASDLGAAERFVVHPGRELFPLSEATTAIPLADLMERLEALA